MASRSDGVTRLYEAPQAPEPERLPQPTKTKDKVLLDERGLLDLPFLALTVLLVLIGVVMVFSASYARAYYLTGNSTYYFARQAIFAVVGIGGMLFVSRLNYQLWRSASFIILAVSVVFLMLVPLIGSTANGAKRWIEVAGIRFQPSELAKIAIIMTFSAMISTYRDKMRTFRYGIAPFGAIMIVLCGLVALERHFSCILIMLLLAAAMLFLGGVQIKWFALGGAAVAVFMFVYLKTQGYAGSRITAWRDPASDPTDNGYQILQSLYAIGSGGLMGLGLGKSCQKYLYLPEEHNDYIFPILCEELGFVGAVVVILLFILLIVRGYYIAMHARDRFGALLAAGISTHIALQTFLNIGVVTNFLPATGISLPFFSYGGTALLTFTPEDGYAVDYQILVEELEKVLTQARLGGMLSGKAGVVQFHMGVGKRGMDVLLAIVRETEIPARHFIPTHVNRAFHLFEQAKAFARLGGYVDITSGIREQDGFPACVKPSDAIKILYKEGVPMDKVTMSSDANGCMSVTLSDGSQKQLAVSPDSFQEEVKAALLAGVPPEIVAKVVSSNPAQANGLYPQKGCLQTDSDADLIIYSDSYDVDTVIAKGQIMVAAGEALFKGTFEK